MKFNNKHKDLLSLVTGRSLHEDVEISGVVYRLSSLKNSDQTWVAEGLENLNNQLLLLKNRKDRLVAAAIVAIGPKGGDLVFKQDMFELPEDEYGEFLKKNDLMMNDHLNEQMLTFIGAMEEKTVSLLYSKVQELHEKVEKAIEDSTPFLKAQDD